MFIVIIKLKQLFAHISVRTKGALNVVFPSQPCHFKKKIINIIIHNVYFFKGRADDKFCS